MCVSIFKAKGAWEGNCTGRSQSVVSLSDDTKMLPYFVCDFSGLSISDSEELNKEVALLCLLAYIAHFPAAFKCSSTWVPM